MLQEEAESKAKHALAEGFQLQDSVKISTQLRQDCDEDVRDEESVAWNDINEHNLVRQEQRGGRSGSALEFQRFMNEVGRTSHVFNWD